MGAPWSIRRAAAEDAPAIAGAERVCFTDPWSEGALLETLQDETSLGLLAEMSGRLAGYLLARTIAGEAEILSVAVLPEARRRGIGRALLEAGLRSLAARAATDVYLEVRESNEGARRLYLASGFRPVGLRPGYYSRPRESAFVLWRPLAPRA